MPMQMSGGKRSPKTSERKRKRKLERNEQIEINNGNKNIHFSTFKWINVFRYIIIWKWTVGQSRDVHFALETTISFRRCCFFSRSLPLCLWILYKIGRAFSCFVELQSKTNDVQYINLLRKSMLIDSKSQ